jgi:recombination protein RecA
MWPDEPSSDFIGESPLPTPPEDKKPKGKKKLAPTEVVPFAVVRQHLEKQYGAGVLVPARGMVSLAIPRIPFGIFPLDYALVGGLPAARISLLSGQKGCGKSTGALKASANYQRLCSRCCLWREQCQCAQPEQSMVVWIDVEGVFDPAWAEVMGVDLDENRFYLGRPEFAEQAIDIIDAVLRTNEVGFVVLDSIAQMTPTTEIEDTAMNWQQGLQARLVNKMMRKVVSAVQEGRRQGRMPTVLLINQLREKVTGFGHSIPMVEPGGRGQLFGSSVVIRMRQKEIHWEGSDKSRPPQAVTMGFKVQYSKVSPPGMEGEFTLALKDYEAVRKGESDDFRAVMGFAKRTGYVRKSLEKPGWYAGDKEFRTLAEITETWLQNRDDFAKAQLAIVERAHAPQSVPHTLSEEDEADGEAFGQGPGGV